MCLMCTLWREPLYYCCIYVCDLVVGLYPNCLVDEGKQDGRGTSGLFTVFHLNRLLFTPAAQ